VNPILRRSHCNTNTNDVPLLCSECHYFFSEHVGNGRRLTKALGVQIDGKPIRLRLLVYQVERPEPTLKGSETELYRRIQCHTLDMSVTNSEVERKQIYVLQDEQAEHIMSIGEWAWAQPVFTNLVK
jgi:hypothetical protein